tara:strand:+ start:589 stop:1752 length:1164 start_codon:yes stop_codon:yes gene_type:complete
MALPLILGLLGSSLGAGSAIGAIGAGALGSGLGRFMETGDFEEGVKTGALSFFGGQALGKGLEAFGGAGSMTPSNAPISSSLGQNMIKPTQTFGQNLMTTLKDPVSLGQATIAQGAIPPPAMPEEEDVDFDNRERMAPRRIMRRPPPGYRPGFDAEFDYGVAPNYGTQVMNMGGLVGLLGNPKVQDALSNVAGIALNPAMQREANNLMTGEFTPEGYSPLTMADAGMKDGGQAEMQGNDPQEIMLNAIRALQGMSSDPEKDISVFVQAFGSEALRDLQMRVASGEMGGGEAGLGRLLEGEGDGMSDSIDAEIVSDEMSPSGSGEPLKVADGEYVVAADAVADIGNGSTNAGAKKLDDLMKEVRRARHGTTKQPPEKNMMNVIRKSVA